ncbi:syndecan-3-like isoform X2 [Macrobrachium nipponense]|uniref:syndecan-3-like isoform X2 n=1 Tax=Macrobrachium nipponense TaxID=159736 RepID=UPI0030C7E078
MATYSPRLAFVLILIWDSAMGIPSLSSTSLSRTKNELALSDSSAPGDSNSLPHTPPAQGPPAPPPPPPGPTTTTTGPPTPPPGPTTTTTTSSITTSPTTTSSTTTSPTTTSSITTSPTTTSSITTSPTTTPKPKTKKEVLEETDTVLQNINSTLQEFQDALTRAEATTTTPKPETSVLKREDLAQPLIDLMHFKGVLAEESTSICVEKAEQSCKDLEKTLNDIDDQLQILKSNVDSWDQENLNRLMLLNSTLYDQMSYATTPAFINANLDKTETNRRLESMEKSVEDAKTAVQNEIDSLNEGSDGVIFAAVFGTLGGLIIVALIAGIAFRAIKSSKNKTEKNTEHNKLSEASVPVEGFLRDQDNLGYVDDEPARTRDDVYPMQNFSRPAPLAKDPYRRPQTRPVEDLYAKPLTSRRPQISPIPRNNYSRPGSPAGDNYYSRPKSDYYSAPGPSRDDGRGEPRSRDPYSAPSSGMRRYN